MGKAHCDMNRTRAIWHVAIAVGVGFVAAMSQAAEPLRLVESIQLPNVVGRIDHIAADYSSPLWETTPSK